MDKNIEKFIKEQERFNKWVTIFIVVFGLILAAHTIIFDLYPTVFFQNKP